MMIFDSTQDFHHIPYFRAFISFLGPAATNLNYWGSDFRTDWATGTDKCGPSCKVQPIDEPFNVLY